MSRPEETRRITLELTHDDYAVTCQGWTREAEEWEERAAQEPAGSIRRAGWEMLARGYRRRLDAITAAWEAGEEIEPQEVETITVQIPPDAGTVYDFPDGIDGPAVKRD
jgi:hypothetical protein